MNIFGRFSFKSASRKNYDRSNAIVKVDFQPSQKARNLVKTMQSASLASRRQKLGQDLIDELSQICRIEKANLKISQTRQWHKRRNGRIIFKQYGYYRSKSNYIYIQNQTPVRGKAIAPKTFLNTLLHEWIHHYDHQKLKLYSIHSRGFYLRLSSLKNKLGA